MANILFKRGSQSALNSLIENKKGIDGAFYLTEDTHRLYAGIQNDDTSTVEIVDLNKYIRSFNTLSALQSGWTNPEIGDFAYISEGNILATYTEADGTTKWVQINPDTNTDTSLSKATFVKETIEDDDGNNTITVTLTLTQKDINGKDLENPITTSFVLNSADIASITTDVAVDLESSVASNVATIKVGGTGADTSATADTVIIKGGNGISITSDGTDDIVIDGVTYDLNTVASTTDGQIALKGSNNVTDTVKIIGNDNWIDVTSDANGNVNIVHTGPSTGSEVTTTPTDGVAISKTSPKLTAVVGVEADSKGHITGVKTTEFTLPDSDFTLGTIEGDIDGSEDTTNDIYTTQVLLKNSAGNNIGTADIKVAHKITIDGEAKIVNNGGDLGSFYSASAIDSKLTALDAMVYRGTVGSAADLSTAVTEGVSIGDTFKASEDFTLNGVEISAGDILIANVAAGSTENADGQIDAEDIVWDHIATGADTDTTYEYHAADNNLVLSASTGKSFKVAVADDDKWIEATAADDTLTIKHITITPTDVSNTAKEIANRTFTAVTGVIRDDAGHVTGVTTDELIIEDMNNKLSFTEGEEPSFDLRTSKNVRLQTIKFKDAGEKIDIDGALAVNEDGTTDDTTLVITAKHEKLESAAADTPAEGVDVALDGNGTIKALTGVDVDEYGHITGFQTTTYTVAKDENTTYTYAVDTADSSATVARLQLKNNSNVENNVDLTSNTLTFTASAAAVNIDFVWGTFES